jgi:hypothetical protein
MTIFPLSDPLNENKINEKCEIALPFLLVHSFRENKKTTNPSSTQFFNFKVQIGKYSKNVCVRKCMASCLHALPLCSFCLREKEKHFNLLMRMQSFYKFNPIFHNSRPLIINSPSQNEIVGRFPGRVLSGVVRLFSVWTPSQTQTYVFHL